MSVQAVTVPWLPAAQARLILGTAGLGLLVAARAAVNGATTASAFGAGVMFGAALIGLALVMGWRAGGLQASAVALGLVGGVILAAAPLVASGSPTGASAPHALPVAAWIAVTALVAGAEEVALRGALWQAALDAQGPLLAIVVTSIAFALMHVPLYGWHVVPLDLSVGVFLGGLRLVSGGVAAPVIAHGLADLVTWWA